MLDTLKNMNPQWGYLVVAGLLLIYLIGLILDLDWTLEPGSGPINLTNLCDIFGRTTVRLVLGFFTSAGIVACLFGAFYHLKT